MVTSFRARSSRLQDDSVLTTIRPVSDLSQLYFEFSEYRLELLEERIRDQLRILRDNKKAKKRFSTSKFKKFLTEQADFLLHMNAEMVFESEVKAGKQKEASMLNTGRVKKRALEV